MNIIFTFNRKIADRLFVPLFLKTPLRPNHITCLALLAGVTAGGFMAQGHRSGLLLGAAFLQLSMILDNCDGQIARLKSMQSAFGMWFDFIADLAVDFCLWGGLALGAWKIGGFDRRWIVLSFVFALVGSGIHFLRSTQKRLEGQSGKEPPQTTHVLLSAAHILARDGDPSILVWFLAFLGEPAWFLVLGAIYINLLWIVDTSTSHNHR